MDRQRLRKAANIFIAVAVAGSWLGVFFFGSGTLLQNGFGSMKFFTMQSNIFAGIMAAAWLVSTRRSEDGRASALVERLKYIAAASVGLTFATVMGFLGPLYGYPAMFTGGNFFMHLVTPLAAMLEIVLLSDVRYTRRDNLLAVLPPLIYGLGYLANILINGFGEWPDTNDWYLFFHWGYPVGILIYAVLLAVTWLIGLLLCKLQRNSERS